MSCGEGRRLSSDLMLLWLWCRPAAAALIRPLAGEPPCAVGVALKRQEKKKKVQLRILKNVNIKGFNLINNKPVQTAGKMYHFHLENWESVDVSLGK